MSTGPDLRFGYIDITSTDDNVFALFSGRTRQGSEGTASFGRFLHVYDWNGQLIRVFELDADLIALTVTPDGSRVFALRHEPLASVVRYEIPELH